VFQPWPDLLGEKFERAENVFLRKVTEEARDQLEAPETEFGVEGRDPLGHRLGTADNRHFP
jgi:hypothetical protein